MDFFRDKGFGGLFGGAGTALSLLVNLDGSSLFVGFDFLSGSSVDRDSLAGSSVESDCSEESRGASFEILRAVSRVLSNA